jgi:hypothetical protein
VESDVDDVVWIVTAFRPDSNAASGRVSVGAACRIPSLWGTEGRGGVSDSGAAVGGTDIFGVSTAADGAVATGVPIMIAGAAAGDKVTASGFDVLRTTGIAPGTGVSR